MTNNTQKPISNNPYINNTNANSSVGSNATPNNSLLQNNQKDFLKGALIGAVATFILTNENAQKAIFKGFAKVSGLFEMGIEELKERYEDAKAEVQADEQ
ncbi:YtxH domain-containing protein [Helicobacter burdigaliensis]|uniref:YtxH domain-containing protein n=1 Tax=Helicobacter burdigaliensis TaxID=2315334 RepID=UPI000EF65C3E|nr:YtxH domain-containing protein [Helicobacter burdigaliensis]